MREVKAWIAMIVFVFAIGLGASLDKVFAQTETITETQFVIPFAEYLNEGTFMMLFVILIVGAVTIIILKRVRSGKK